MKCSNLMVKTETYHIVESFGRILFPPVSTSSSVENTRKRKAPSQLAQGFDHTGVGVTHTFASRSDEEDEGEIKEV